MDGKTSKLLDKQLILIDCVIKCSNIDTGKLGLLSGRLGVTGQWALNSKSGLRSWSHCYRISATLSILIFNLTETVI